MCRRSLLHTLRNMASLFFADHLLETCTSTRLCRTYRTKHFSAQLHRLVGLRLVCSMFVLTLHLTNRFQAPHKRERHDRATPSHHHLEELSLVVRRRQRRRLICSSLFPNAIRSFRHIGNVKARRLTHVACKRGAMSL